MIRLSIQTLLFFLCLLLIWHGFTGPQFAPKNFTTILSWVHFRGVLVLLLLLVGNYFCSVCPMMLARNLARRFYTPKLEWPRNWQKKWPALVLFVAVLFCYELFDLWASPVLTSILILVVFVLAIVTDIIFKKASFCKYLCPVGQFNFLSSTISPQIIKVKDEQICAQCNTYECLKGNPNKRLTGKIGCELDLFLPQKVGNLDCTFCMECVQACPSQNVSIQKRPAGSELWDTQHRAGIGKLEFRSDIQWFILIFMMAGLVNAFAMTPPYYQLLDYFSLSEFLWLALLFTVTLVIVPWLLKRTLAVSSILSLLPFAFSLWLAHYSFHFFTGALTFIPLLGFDSFPIKWMGLSLNTTMPIEFGMILLGLTGTIVVQRKQADQRTQYQAYVITLILTIIALWILTLPMEMRGTTLGMH